MATLPPWLDVQPQQFLGATEAGARVGLSRDQLREEGRQFNENIGLKRDEFEQQKALAAADLGMKAMEMKVRLAEFQNKLKQQDLDNKIKIEAHTRDQDRADQKLAYDKQYKSQIMDWHKGQLDEQKAKFEQQSTTAARKYQVQRQVDAEIAAGGNPSEVIARHAAELGIPYSGLAALIREGKTEGRPEANIFEEGGLRFIRQPDGKITQVREPSAGTATANDRRINQYMNWIKNEEANNPAIHDPESEDARTYTEVRRQLSQLMGIGGGATAPAGAPPKISGFNIRPAGTAAPTPAPAPASAAIEPAGGEEGAAPVGNSLSPGSVLQTGTANIPLPTGLQPTPAPARAPATLPTTQQTPSPEPPTYIKEYMNELAFGKGYQSKGAKDLLKDMIAKMPSEELAQRGQQYGLKSTYDARTGRLEAATGGDKFANYLTRAQFEEELYKAALEKGWK